VTGISGAVAIRIGSAHSCAALVRLLKRISFWTEMQTRILPKCKPAPLLWWVDLPYLINLFNLPYLPYLPVNHFNEFFSLGKDSLCLTSIE
jgi:hypothetical protein